MDDKSSSEEEGCIIQTKGDPILQNSECCDEVLESERTILISTPGDNRSHPYCSTPLVNRDEAASRLGQQDVLLEYKSFFAVECEEIINQLRQGWKVDKRKLEELDFSTIEAEPPPFCCTPNSVLDDTTYRAKRRRCNDPDSPETQPQFCSTQHKNKSVCQSMQKSKDGLRRLSSEAPKCKLFQKTSRLKHSGYTADFLHKGRIGGFLASVLHVPKQQIQLRSPSAVDSTSFHKHELFLKDKNNPEAMKHRQGENDPESPGSSIQPLEFRSFFYAECENIYNRLKRCDALRHVHDVSTIDAEPPPNLSSSITFLSDLDSSHAKTNSNVGVTQLDLEKMNFSKDEGSSVQKSLNNTPYSSKTNCSVKVTASSTTKTVRNMHVVGSVADITQDIVAVCNGLSAADATQDIVNICDRVNVTQDFVTISDKVYASKATLDIANATQEIMTEHGNTAANIIQDIKMDVSVANATQEIVPMCDQLDSNATTNIVMHGTDAEQQMATFCNCDPAAGRLLNTTTTHSLQDVKTKCEKMPFPNIISNKGNMHCMPSVADTTYSTETCADEPLLGITQDIMTIHRNAHLAKVAQDRELNVPITQKCVLMAGGGNIPKTALRAVNGKNSIKNTTFLCTERKPDQGGLAVDDTGNFIQANKKTLSKFCFLPSLAIDCTDSVGDSGQGYVEGSTFLPPSMPATSCLQVTQTTKEVVIAAMPTSIAKDSIEINQAIKESNITLSFPSGPSKANTNGNLLETNNTKVISANCTLIVDPQVTQPSIDERGCRVVSPGGVSKTGTICDLDMTHIASEESVFCEGPFTFTTSTPLPCFNNHVFIKKAGAGSVQEDSKLFPNRVQTEVKQITKPKLLNSGQPTRGNVTQIRQLSKGFLVPCPSKNSIPRLPKPVTSFQTLRPPVTSTTVIKTPQITRLVTADKGPMGLNRTNRIPAGTSTGLPRRTVGIIQRTAGNTANRIPQQKDLPNCFWAGKGSFITKGEDTNALTFAKPPIQICTPANKIPSGKVVNMVSGSSNTVRDSKASFLPTPHSVGPKTLGFARPDHTFIRTPAGPQTVSKIKPPASALPVKRLQAAPISRNTRAPQ